MNVCLISNEYPPETGFGGIGTYTYHLAHGLIKAGHRVTVISQAQSKESFQDDNGVRVYRIKNHKMPIRGFSRIGNLLTRGGFSYQWHSRSVFSKIKQLINQGEKFDLIEGPLWDAECYAYSNDLGVPLVIRLQTPIFKSRQILGLPRQRAAEQIEKKSLEKATLIISISKNVGEMVGQHYDIPRAKIHNVPLGIESPKLTKSLFKENSYKLLYVGRLEKRKGTEELIQALPDMLIEVPKLTIDIVGRDCFQAPGNISYLAYFEQVVPENLRSRVRFHGFVEKRRLDKFYQNCDLFIAPSRYESFGLIFLEAMAFGKPVIGTKVGGIPEVITDGEVGYLAPENDPEQLAQLVIKIMNNPTIRKSFGQQALKRFNQQFTIEKMVTETLKVYRLAHKKYHRSFHG